MSHILSIDVQSACLAFSLQVWFQFVFFVQIGCSEEFSSSLYQSGLLFVS